MICAHERWLVPVRKLAAAEQLRVGKGTAQEAEQSVARHVLWEIRGERGRSKAVVEGNPRTMPMPDGADESSKISLDQLCL